MTLVRVGKYVINMDNVAYVDLEAKDWHDNPCLDVVFSATSGEVDLQIRLSGDDAQKFKGYLEQREYYQTY